ncbi:MAG: hypothetical protein OXM55_01495 [Bdellovibrionales bacterium]|nr:hypothetical protein [Bdellovibrionales bacterium]
MSSAYHSIGVIAYSQEIDIDNISDIFYNSNSRKIKKSCFFKTRCDSAVIYLDRAGNGGKIREKSTAGCYCFY